MTGITSVRRSLVLLLAAAVTAASALAAPPVGAGAPPPPELPAVQVQIFLGPSTGFYRDCDGTDVPLLHEGGGLVQREGPILADLTVQVTVTGTLAGQVVDPPTEVVIPAGEESVPVIFGFAGPAGPGSIGLEVEPGVGYVLGERPSESQDLAAPGVEIDCDDPITLLPDEGVLDQTIEVGEVPAPLRLYESGFVPRAGGPVEPRDLSTPTPDTFDTPVAGALPPGLTFAEDTWGGVATTPGTYAFEVRLCGVGDLFGTEGPVCIGHVDVTIEVLAAGAVGPGDSPPAEPIATDARFTG